MRSWQCALVRDRRGGLRRSFPTDRASRRPAEARISPLTVPSTVVNAIAEMIANSSSLKLRAKSGAAKFVSVSVERAARHRAQAHVQREHIKEADAGDANDGALAADASSFTV